ncbi:MAG: hypothetical protein R3178_05065 [Rhodothermales bacterium]|nr:hypothetical protein [Rhodothermales bacterium]
MACLTVILCETRELDRTYDALQRRLLDRLPSDLALCVSSSSDGHRSSPTYHWRIDDPSGSPWDDFLAREFPDIELGPLREYLPSKGIFGGISGTKGSGLIVMAYREFLWRYVQTLPERYDWLLITRSDFMWLVDHPPMDFLDPNFIYAMSGERYGGVSDRYALVPRRLWRTYFEIPGPIFRRSSEFVRELRSAAMVVKNPESLIAYRSTQLGLQYAWLPYMGYTIRSRGGRTRWSGGYWDPAEGAYIKYPFELIASRALEQMMAEGDFDWRRYFSMPMGERAEILETLEDRIGRLSRQPRYRVLLTRRPLVRGLCRLISRVDGRS